MRSLPIVLIAAACVATAAGCAPATPVDSTLSGTIAQSTFPAPVATITAVSDTGAVTAAAVDAAGAFSFDLGSGGTYRFLLSPDGKSTPLVVRTVGGRLETQLTVTSAAASVDLGQVRYWAGSSLTPLSVSVVTGTTTSTATGACVAGVIQGSSQPCSSGVATLVCAEDGDHGGGMCDGKPMSQTSTPATPVVVSDPTTDATAVEPVAIPVNSLPASIGCADEHPHGF